MFTSSLSPDHIAAVMPCRQDSAEKFSIVNPESETIMSASMRRASSAQVSPQPQLPGNSDVSKLSARAYYEGLTNHPGRQKPATINARRGVGKSASGRFSRDAEALKMAATTEVRPTGQQQILISSIIEESIGQINDFCHTGMLERTWEKCKESLERQGISKTLFFRYGNVIADRHGKILLKHMRSHLELHIRAVLGSWKLKCKSST